MIRHDSFRHLRIGGIVISLAMVAPMIGNLPRDLDLLDRQRPEVMLTIGIIVRHESIEMPNSLDVLP